MIVSDGPDGRVAGGVRVEAMRGLFDKYNSDNSASLSYEEFAHGIFRSDGGVAYEELPYSNLRVHAHGKKQVVVMPDQYRAHAGTAENAAASAKYAQQSPLESAHFLCPPRARFALAARHEERSIEEHCACTLATPTLRPMRVDLLWRRCDNVIDSLASQPMASHSQREDVDGSRLFTPQLRQAGSPCALACQPQVPPSERRVLRRCTYRIRVLR